MMQLTTRWKTAPAMHALVVDDDAFTLELVRDMLVELGVAHVTAAKNGSTGMTCIERDSSLLDLVVCDLNMPGKDGFELMDVLSKKRFAGGVILMSGLSERMVNSAALMGRFHQLRILGAFQKPLSKTALRDALWKMQETA